jgi:GNAT superfamily N-acetyltransferase
MTNVCIRYEEIRPCDIDRVTPEIDSLQDQTLGGPDYNERWSAEKVARRLELGTRQGIVLAARNGSGRLVGACFGMPLTLSETGMRLTGWMANGLETTFVAAGLFVCNGHQRMGIGSTMIRMRLLHFWERGFHDFTAITNAYGKQLDLYRKLGYEISEAHHVPGLRNPKVVVRGNIREIAMTSFGIDPGAEVIVPMHPVPVPEIFPSAGLGQAV